MEGHRWSTLDSSGGRGAKAEAIDCTWSSANAPNLVCFQHVLRVRALVNFSGILVYQILQKASDEGTLFWATGSHEIMVFAITDKCSDSQTSRRLRTNIVLTPLTFGENIAPAALTIPENVLTFG
jgi:hypothetical protein